MWCIMPLVVLVLLLSVAVGGLHVCISLPHAAIAKVMKDGELTAVTEAP